MIPEQLFLTETMDQRTTICLSNDRMTAIAKMAEIEQIYKELPHLDCGSCGAPNCHALAEDIVKGEATRQDCLIQLREHYGQDKP